MKKWLAYSIVASGLFFFACGGKDKKNGEDCSVGSEGCACTSGGACDPGLQCLSNLCVEGTSPGSGGEGGDNGGGTGGTSTGGTTADGTGGDDGGGDDDCVPYTSDSGCDGDDWCRARNDGTGTCVTPGDDALGDSCSADSCIADAVCSLSGTCSQVCDPSAVDGGVSDCAELEACLLILEEDQMGVSLTPPFLGACTPGCDYHGGMDCEDGSSTCYPGELRHIQQDFCLMAPEVTLDPYEPCETSQLGNLCAAASVCVSLETENILCVPLCFESEGAFGDAAHPDCPTDTAICEESEGFAFGFCVEPT